MSATVGTGHVCDEIQENCPIPPKWRENITETENAPWYTSSQNTS